MRACKARILGTADEGEDDLINQLKIVWDDDKWKGGVVLQEYYSSYMIRNHDTTTLRRWY